MRNWNELSQSVPSGSTGTLPDYLWGIETHQRQSPCVDSRASRLPMRNWNSSWQGSKASKRASRLPMRNWNQRWTASDTVCRASRLPMRNWNIDPTTSFLHRPPGFQTTYEELKPCSCFALTIPFACFQTTYEELKQGWILKKWTLSFSLPDYLWGIETRARRGYRHRNVPLPDYLWGIETNVPVVFFIVFVLPDYLWGIETSDSCLWYADSPASRLPMRNWNTNPASPKDAIQFPLPDYLWGIETISNIKTWVIVSGFQTTYEELKLSWAHLLPL